MFARLSAETFLRSRYLASFSSIMVWELVPGVWKEIVTGGKGSRVDFVKNTKVIFHFKTFGVSDPQDTDPDADQLIDDTRELGLAPFELLIGREFKVPVWEDMVKSMTVGEVARFGCMFKHIMEYGKVSKVLRQMAKKQRGEEVDHSHDHQCGFATMAMGTGHADLDSIIADKSPLVFEFELLGVENPGDYQQEVWQLTTQEKLERAPKLRAEGNALYKQGKHVEAGEKYREALGCLEGLSAMEQLNSPEWKKLQDIRLPLLLNYAQCKLLSQDYAEVIRHTSSALEYDPDNLKALFRRGKAHACSWNEVEAKSDFARVVELDPSLSGSVQKELQQLEHRMKKSRDMEKVQMRNADLFGTK